MCTSLTVYQAVSADGLFCLSVAILDPVLISGCDGAIVHMLTVDLGEKKSTVGKKAILWQRDVVLAVGMGWIDSTITVKAVVEPQYSKHVSTFQAQHVSFDFLELDIKLVKL